MSTASNGILVVRKSLPVSGLLGILFVGLKLTGYIDWSWWWVTLPFWWGLALFALIFVVGCIVILIAELIDVVHDANMRKRHKMATLGRRKTK